MSPIISYSTLIAQQKLGVKSVISASASKRENLGQNLTIPVNGVSTNFTISSVSMQVGMPYMGLTKGATISAANSQNYIKDLGFPWGIRYLYNTFSEDAFTVSKGYFSDRIELNWDIKKNQEKIISISVFRTEDLTSVNPSWGNPLKTLAGDVGTFSDTNVEGGKLYRYKIFAKGVEVDKLEIKYSNYITGIGYRNPTGVITGNISYTGGNPVKDVMIVANPTRGGRRLARRVQGGRRRVVPLRRRRVRCGRVAARAYRHDDQLRGDLSPPSPARDHRRGVGRLQRRQHQGDLPHDGSGHPAHAGPGAACRGAD